jgi:IS30 family transposase
VTDKLRLLWSPEQIAGRLKHAYPHDQSHCVSHETIYRTLFIQARGALKKELLQHLRRTRAMRRSRHHTQKTEIHGQIVGAMSISERPASPEDRAVPGHWEGDLMFGSQNSQIATLVERQTRYVMLAKVASKDTETVVDALIKNARKLLRSCTGRSPGIGARRWPITSGSRWPPTFRSTSVIHAVLGSEAATRTRTACSRQYMPKGIDISSYSQAKLNAVARQLNERPRKTLGYQTPAEMFSHTVASIG